MVGYFASFTRSRRRIDLGTCGWRTCCIETDIPHSSGWLAGHTNGLFYMYGVVVLLLFSLCENMEPFRGRSLVAAGYHACYLSIAAEFQNILLGMLFLDASRWDLNPQSLRLALFAPCPGPIAELDGQDR